MSDRGAKLESQRKPSSDPGAAGRPRQRAKAVLVRFSYLSAPHPNPLPVFENPSTESSRPPPAEGGKANAGFLDDSDGVAADPGFLALPDILLK